jgi:hypothetical protein
MVPSIRSDVLFFLLCCAVCLFYESIHLNLYDRAGRYSYNAFRLVFGNCLSHILAVVFNNFPQSLRQMPVCQLAYDCFLQNPFHYSPVILPFDTEITGLSDIPDNCLHINNS